MTTDATGEAVVTFNTSFGSTSYAIELTTQVGGDETYASYRNKAATGFDIVVYDDGGKTEPDIVVDWFIIGYYDP